MARAWTGFIALIVLSIPTACPAGDFDYAAYRIATLSSAGSELGIDPKADWWLDASHPRFHVIASVTGKTRRVRRAHRKLLGLWATTMGHGPQAAASYSVEIQARQGSVLYWLPMQKVLLEPWQREVAPGSPVHLYVLFAGAHKGKPLFVVNEFEATP